MNRREFFASLGVAAVGRPARRDHATPPGVVARQTYDVLKVDDLTMAHDEGFALVGRTADSNEMRIVVTDTAGRIRASRRLTPPEEMEGFPVLAIVRTADGYAVSSGGWLGILAPDLTVEAKTAAPGSNTLGSTQTVAAGPGVVVAYEADAPNAEWVTVTGYDSDGDYQWHQRYGGAENPHMLGFLASGPNGVVIGGDSFASGLWMAGLTSDGDQQWLSTNAPVDPENEPAAVFNGGLIVFDGATLTKLDDSRSIVWERSYDSFSDRPPQLVSLPDGGTLAGTGTTVGAFDQDGRLQWVRDYDVADARHLGGLLALRDGEYVAVGSIRGGESASGWFLRLSSSVTPTASPTPSPTTTDTPTVTTGRTASDTTISMPGFGPAAAFVALAGIADWLRRRAAT